MATLTCREGATARYSATLTQDDGVTPMPGSSLTSLTLTLKDADTSTAINSRTAQNVLGANGVTVSEAGALVWRLDPADNPIVDDTKRTEQHIALLTWTWGSPLKTGRSEIEIWVRNLHWTP